MHVVPLPAARHKMQLLISVAELDWKSTRQDNVTHRTLNTLRNLAAGTHTSRIWQVACIVYEVLQHHCPGTPVSFGRD